MPPELDDIDYALLKLVQSDDRSSYNELGQAVGLSISGVNSRLKRLISTGVIRRFSAQIQPEAVGLGICAFIQVGLGRPEDDEPFIASIAGNPAVLECHHVTGDYSYLLKVRVASTAALERLISHEIKRTAGVVRSHTVIALSSPKETSELDLRRSET